MNELILSYALLLLANGRHSLHKILLESELLYIKGRIRICVGNRIRKDVVDLEIKQLENYILENSGKKVEVECMIDETII